MTRQEFMNGVNEWWDLKDIAEDHGYEGLNDVVDTETIGEEIKYRAGEIGYGDDWERFASWLDDIPAGYRYYAYSDYYGTYEGLSEGDFYDYKQDMLDWMDENDMFDHDDGDTEGDEDNSDVREAEAAEDVINEEEVAEEDFSVGELLSMCFADVAKITRESDEARRSFEQEFESAFDSLTRI